MNRVVAADALLAAAIFVATAALARDALPLQVALTAPLAWRRQAPALVFGLVAAAALVQWLLDLRLPADIALLVAIYTVGAHCALRWLVAAGIVLEAGIIMYAISWGGFLVSVTSLTSAATAAAVLGVVMRMRRAQVTRDKEAAVAQERSRIARELHDIVSHNLSVMIALADGALFALPRKPDTAETAIRQVAGTGREALTDMRRLLGVLRDDAE